MACLYLVRHAIAEPAGSFCAGCRTDGPLTAEGQAQARAAAPGCRGCGPPRCMPAPCAQPGNRPAAGRPGRGDPGAAGAAGTGHGRVDGKRFADIRRSTRNCTPPGGESGPDAAGGGEFSGGSGPHEPHPGRHRRAAERAGGTGGGQPQRGDPGVSVPDHRPALPAEPPPGAALRRHLRGGIRPGGLALPAGRRTGQPVARSARHRGALAGLRRGEPARLHGETVARVAVRICRRLAAAGLVLDEDLVRTAALLHDLCRHQPHHPQAAARLLRRSDISGWRRWWRFTRRETTGPNPTRKGWCSWRTSWCRDAKKPPSWPALPKAGINAAHPRLWPLTSGG